MGVICPPAPAKTDSTRAAVRWMGGWGRRHAAAADGRRAFGRPRGGQSSDGWADGWRGAGGGVGVFGIFRGASRRANPRLAPRVRPHPPRGRGDGWDRRLVQLSNDGLGLHFS
eukprot:gene10922-biopygen7803